MSYRLNTNVSDEQAKQMGASVTREQFENYMNNFVPAENKLIGSLGEDNAEAAAGGAAADAQRSRASLERMRSRYGTKLSGGQQQAEGRQSQNSQTLSTLGARNTGRQLDEDRDFNLRGTLLNIGNNLSSSATSGLAEGATNAQARENSYDRAKAQHSAQKSQQTASTVASVASLAAMAFMM